MEEAGLLVLKSVLGYGALGIVCILGWALALALLYIDYKRKDKVSVWVEEKDKEIVETKDKMADLIKELAEKRIADLKEVTEDYNKLASDVSLTLEKLTLALEAKRDACRKE